MDVTSLLASHIFHSKRQVIGVVLQALTHVDHHFKQLNSVYKLLLKAIPVPSIGSL